MDNPGAFSLGDFAITAPGTQLGPWISTLQGLSAVALQARLAYGNGGTACQAYVQTSLDQGQTWCDVACFAFAAAGGVLLTGLTSAGAPPAPVAPSDGALADNTTLPGILGDRMRVKVVTTGTYGNGTLLSVWGVAK